MRRGGSSRLNIVSISKYSTTAASKANTNAVPAVSSTSSAPALTGLVSAYNDSSDSEPEPNVCFKDQNKGAVTVSQTHGASTADDDDVLAEFLAEVNSETVAAVIKESSKSSASSTIAVKNVVNEEDEAEEWETFWDDSRKDFSYYQTDTFEVKHTQFKQRKSISSSPIVPRLSHLLQHVSGQSMTVETESLLISIQTLFQRIKNLIAEEAPGSALQFYAAKLIEESRVFLVRLQDWRNGNLNQDYFCSIFQHWKSQVASIKATSLEIPPPPPLPFDETSDSIPPPPPSPPSPSAPPPQPQTVIKKPASKRQLDLFDKWGAAQEELAVVEEKKQSCSNQQITGANMIPVSKKPKI